MTVDVPAGWRVALDRQTRALDASTLVGGSPPRLLRLTDAGACALVEIRDGAITSPGGRQLARRLTDAGLAHPRPAGDPVLSVVFVVPVRDRADLLDQCLASLGDQVDILVVDDGSVNSVAISEVCRRHGAQLHRRETSGGPAAARNAGIALTDSDVVVVVDSDCTVPHGPWLRGLLRHLVDPTVAVVAPRVVPGTDRGDAAGRRLDRGDLEALVTPRGRVSFVPSAVLVMRRQAVQSNGSDHAVFDEQLRYGEDVDLLWRLHDAGWRIRYEPAIEVSHREPVRRRDRLRRSFAYGTSAAPLAVRHGDRVAPLAARPWPLTAVVACLAGYPGVAAAAAAVTVGVADRSARRLGLPHRLAARWSAAGLADAWLSTGRCVTELGLPVMAAAAVAPGRRRRRRAAAAILLIAGPGVRRWMTEQPPSSLVAGIADDVVEKVAYGAGVWSGCWRHRTLRPMRPVVVRRPATPARNA